MIFNSLDFLLFLPCALALFYLAPKWLKVGVLVLTGYAFYASWNPWYLLLIMASTLTDYLAGLVVGKAASSTVKKLGVAASLLVNLGLLVYFKYADFFITTWNDITSTDHELLALLLPVGISFYTFQTISYTIDVYRGQIQPEKNLLKFAAYVCFFPQLVAGPIERYNTLAPQLSQPKPIATSDVSKAWRLIIYGLFLKMVIADNIGQVVDQTYGDWQNRSSGSLAIAAILYAFQIYGDFKGYTLIAIGVAQLFGINLMNNFRAPYLAVTLTDFWRRWHISLTNWFRDYVYYPMGGNRNGKGRMLLAIFIVFLVSGIWHGAAWHFVIWGALHGLLVLLEKLTGFDRPHPNKGLQLLQGLGTFILVCALWVFFRSPDAGTAWSILSNIVNGGGESYTVIPAELWGWLLVFVLLEILSRKQEVGSLLQSWSAPLRWSTYFVLLFLIMTRGGTIEQPFIYFQF